MMILGTEGQISQQELLLLQANANSADCVPAAAHAPAEPLPPLSPHSSRGRSRRAPVLAEVTGNLLPG